MQGVVSAHEEKGSSLLLTYRPIKFPRDNGLFRSLMILLTRARGNTATCSTVVVEDGSWDRHDNGSHNGMDC